MFSYVKFLEKQLKSTNDLKAKYKKEIEIELQITRKMKENPQNFDEYSPTKLKDVTREMRKELANS